MDLSKHLGHGTSDLIKKSSHLILKKILLNHVLTVVVPSVHRRTPFYSVCRDWILLFQPLTVFVWFGCTCQPPHLCVAPHHQTKRTILFVSLSWHPLPATAWVPSLFLSLMACTKWPSSVLPVWVVCHPSRTLLPKEGNLKICVQKTSR